MDLADFSSPYNPGIWRSNENDVWFLRGNEIFLLFYSWIVPSPSSNAQMGAWKLEVLPLLPSLGNPIKVKAHLCMQR